MPSTATTSSSSSRSGQTTRPLQAVLILSGLYFLARFTGLLQRQIISAMLPSSETAAYNFAFGLPDLLNYLIAGGAISLTFIPIFTRYWEKGREADAWRFFSTLVSVMGVALLALTSFMMLLAPQLLLLIYPGLRDPTKAVTYNLTVQFTRIILPAQLFFYLGGLFVGVLNTFKRFGATGWTSALNNVVAIVFGVILLHVYGPVGFAWGLLLGAFCGNFLLPYLSMMTGPHAQRPRFAFRFDVNDPGVRRFFILALPIMLGVSLPVVDQYVVGFFASFLPTDKMTHLSNSNRLMIAAQGILGQAAAVGAFPFMASKIANGDYHEFSSLVRTGLRRLMFITLPVSVLLILWAQPLTRLLYGYGFYNVPAQLNETGLCFALYTLGLFAWVGQGFVSRGFYALGDTKTPTIIGTVLTFVFFVPLCYLMGRFYGAPGLAFSTSIGAVAYFLSVLLYLDSRMKTPKYRAALQMAGIGGTFLRTAVACLLMALAGGVALWLAEKVIAKDKIGDIGLILWSGGIGGCVFAVAATRFQIPEWIWLQSRLKRKRAAASAV